MSGSSAPTKRAAEAEAEIAACLCQHACSFVLFHTKDRATVIGLGAMKTRTLLKLSSCVSEQTQVKNSEHGAAIRPAMRFETEEAREAYRRGVRDTLDQAHVHIAQPSIRELEHWLKDLGAWSDGPPPPPPRAWA